VVTTLRDAIAQVRTAAGTRAARAEAPPSPSPAQPSFLRGAHPDELFDMVKREAAKTFDVPISLVSIVDMDREFWKTHLGIPADASTSVDPLRESALASQINGADAPQLVGNVAEDRRCSDDRFLVSRGIRAYAVAPLRTADAHMVGMLCVFDTKPRDLSPHLGARLQSIADDLMNEIESRNGVKA
jgi:GAF domain-containing protein